ncbi:MAG: radical SAM protein [Candidatus Schekmanbacteria bacterium]|nr:MAG: radical SAM protein [Candidatus Schekmanbacteria bacterium]
MTADCIHIPISEYSEFSKRIHEKAKETRIPLGGSIEITSRCNLNCLHCYINSPIDNAKKEERGELTTEEIFKILDSIAEEGCLWLLLTGGEPLLRKDFFEIYNYAKKKGFLITLFTNGTLIDEKTADYLADWRPFAVEISVYGRTKETYEKMTAVKGSYEKFLNGLERIHKRNISLKLKAVVTSVNISELDEIKRWATEELNLPFRFDPLINMTLNGNVRPKKVRISAEDVVKLDVNDKERMAEWKKFCDKFLGTPNNDSLFLCGAGINSFHIDSYGNLTPCILVRSESYSLRSGNFKDGYYNWMPKVLSKKRTKKSKCISCNLVAMCGQCPGWAELECGDMEKPVEYLCKIAHLRAEKFFQEWEKNK